MGYQDTLLGSDEHILIECRRHWLAVVRRIWVHVICILVGLALVVFDVPLPKPLVAAVPLPRALHGVVRGSAAVLLLLYPSVVALYRFLRWRTERFIVTNFRVVHVSGIIAKTILDSSLEKVNDVALRQSILGRLLDFGDLRIVTGSDIGVNVLPCLARPLAFKKQMLDAKQELIDDDGQMLEAPGAAPAAGERPARPEPLPEEEASVDWNKVLARPQRQAALRESNRSETLQLLQGLADLRRRGILTEEEFQNKKAKLLSDL